MDKGKAINTFLDRVDQFAQIVLVTDKEIDDLFGEEVTTALTELEHFGKENHICSDCEGLCCSDIECELYAAQFGHCPIYPYRPIACRLHFCHRFDALHRSIIIELRDVFVGCFRAMDFSNSPNLRSLDSPPLKDVCSEFVAEVNLSVNSVRDGKLSPEHAIETIRREAEKHRNLSLTRRAGI